MLIKHQILEEDKINKAHASSLIWAGNGIFRYDKRGEFETITCHCPVVTPGLAVLDSDFQLLVPKVPEKLVIQVLETVKKYGNLERLFYLYWRKTGWELLEPMQEGSQTNCRSLDPYPQAAPIEIHSHGRGEAFFSNTDNLEENGFRVSIVLGGVGNELEIAARACVHGKFLPICPSEVLENINSYCHVISQPSSVKFRR